MQNSQQEFLLHASKSDDEMRDELSYHPLCVIERYAKTTFTFVKIVFCGYNYSYMICKVDEKAMIRDRYNKIPHPVLYSNDIK